ncbi:unnamed protein product [Polarella glacialis]|uniref:Pseudouridine synthase RsuA/RluA-like domain-containing protein n=1 Tax=Polarella glacialis TaxID=89957 RepID=A0A813IXQ4_POLGL|nr:unnamed protein product [Polarella glacialis]
MLVASSAQLLPVRGLSASVRQHRAEVSPGSDLSSLRASRGSLYRWTGGVLGALAVGSRQGVRLARTPPSKPADIRQRQHLPNTFEGTPTELAASLARMARSRQQIPRQDLEIRARQCAAALLKQASEAGASELADAAWALAVIILPEPGPLLNVARAAAAKAECLDPVDLTKLARAAAVLGKGTAAGIGCSELLSVVSKEAARSIHGFQARQLSSLAWAYATAECFEPEIFQLLAEASLKQLPNFAPQGLANLAWAFSSLGHQQPKLFLSIADEALRCLPGFKPQELSNLVWAIAKQDFCDERFAFAKNALTKAAAGKMASFKPQELSNLAWAFAKLRVQDESVMQGIAQAACVILPAATPQSISNLVWAFATMDLRNEALFKRVAEIAPSRLGSFRPQELANLIWAFAKVGFLDDAFWESMLQQALRKMGDFLPQHLCNLAWACATSQVKFNVNLMRSLQLEATAKIHHFNAQGLSTLAWSFASLGIRDVDFFDVIGLQAEQRILDFSPQGLSLLSDAFSGLPALRHQLFSAVSKTSILKMQLFGSQDLSCLLLAFAKVGLQDSSLFQAASVRARSLSLTAFRSRDLSNLLWAFSSVDERAEEFFRSVGSELTGRFLQLAEEEIDSSCDSVGREAKVQELLLDSTEALWAFRNAGLDASDLALAARKCLTRMGQHLDARGFCATSTERCRSLAPLLVEHAPAQTVAALPSRASLPLEPSVALDLSDRLVLLKPAGWEVDGGGDDRDECETADAHDENLLSQFLQNFLPSRRWPLPHDLEHRFGFTHRVDKPSSGLVLAAKTYEAHFDLLLQLSSGAIVRDYIVLCHGWFAPSRRIIRSRVLWTKGGRASSKVRPNGKPALTRLRVLAHCFNRKLGKSASLLAVRIGTGRRHQIRLHLAHLGHPVICDGRYSAVSEFLEDRQWCPRNFLHRHRLSFKDKAADLQEVSALLPADLTVVLKDLTPRDRCHSSSALQTWQQGVTEVDWES